MPGSLEPVASSECWCVYKLAHNCLFDLLAFTTTTFVQEYLLYPINKVKHAWTPMDDKAKPPRSLRSAWAIEQQQQQRKLSLPSPPLKRPPGVEHQDGGGGDDGPEQQQTNTTQVQSKQGRETNS